MSLETAEKSLFEERWTPGIVLAGLLPLISLRLIHVVVGPSNFPTTLTLPVTAVLEIWMLAFPIYMLRRRGFRYLALPRVREVFHELPRAMLYYVLLLLLLGVGLFVWEFVSSKPQSTVSVQRILESVPPSAQWSLIVVAVLLGPIAEETFFRGMIFNAFRQRIAPPFAACLQAILFGFLHYFGLQHALVSSVTGLALALIYAKRKTLLAPIMVHLLFNSVAFAIAIAGMAEETNAPRLGLFGVERAEGCLVEKISEESSAAESGLQPGDLVTIVDGKSVRNTAEIRDIVRAKRVGDTVEITFVRQGETYQVEARLKSKYRVGDESKRNR